MTGRNFHRLLQHGEAVLLFPGAPAVHAVHAPFASVRLTLRQRCTAALHTWWVLGRLPPAAAASWVAFWRAGGVREAYRFKGEEYQLFWPDKSGERAGRAHGQVAVKGRRAGGRRVGGGAGDILHRRSTEYGPEPRPALASTWGPPRWGLHAHLGTAEGAALSSTQRSAWQLMAENTLGAPGKCAQPKPALAA